MLFSFLRSLLCENGRSLRFASQGYSLKKQTPSSNDKTIIELAYHKISWIVSVSQINHDILLNLVQWLLIIDKYVILSKFQCHSFREHSVLHSMPFMILLIKYNCPTRFCVRSSVVVFVHQGYFKFVQFNNWISSSLPILRTICMLIRICAR